MEKYIEGNKAAWEEAFANRSESWCANIVENIKNQSYAYFETDMVRILKKYDMAGKSVGQFCCNNGRELLSLAKSANIQKGVGFDIAENQVEFANEKADELKLPCTFVAANILDIGDEYKDAFDFVIITIGALCWFKDLSAYFKIVSACTKKGGVIIINESHPFTNMLATSDDDVFEGTHPVDCKFSYYSHEWIGNDGMYYITNKNYQSKTFTDYTHSLSEIMNSMCKNGFVITGFEEYQYDISDDFVQLDNKGFPLSMIIEGKK